ncbi:hypothetical protein IB265_30970 [Ensifer sp. ENS10]|uniref:hypothetical protein n=1 Tax=Ensifer sp. ENS10 TaxID=2769286 RepID=UPI00177E05C3|nr:hypothetical protein [Ensifer sp. ENS10]MBD9511193.1 hypothetical protein [Ensifer sp. ENS10]
MLEIAYILPVGDPAAGGMEGEMSGFTNKETAAGLKRRDGILVFKYVDGTFGNFEVAATAEQFSKD